MIEFDHKPEHSRTQKILYRPIAKVYLLRQGNEWIAEYFYVDSGADYTLIPYQLGKFLGLERDASDVKEIGGIGGIIGARFVTVPMKIGTHQFDCVLAWAQIERVPFLLGRESVFDHFDITFHQRNKKTIFDWRGK